MLVRLRSLPAQLLPHGPLDAVRQLLLFAAAYYAYRLSRGVVNDPQAATVAFENARELIYIEQALGVFVEPSVQAWTSGIPALLDFSSWMYINAQSSVTLGAIVYLYLFHNASFYFVRNMFMVAWGIAIVGYIVYPTAPPRFMPEWGFVDSVAEFTGVSHDSTAVNALFNPYAAVPVDARRLRPDDRHPARPSVQASCNQDRLGAVPLARDLRDRGHRQPLHRRRRPGRSRRRRCGLGRRLARPGPPRRVGVQPRQGLRHRLMSSAPPGPRPTRGAGGRRAPISVAERRELVRNRLIDSRLTPNAISLTGLVLNLVAAVLVVDERFILGGIAFIVGSVMDTLDGRYSRMSGKGTQFGAFLDSTLDRIEEGIVLAAVAWVFAERGESFAAAAVVVAVLASLMVSYTRARAEALGVECKVGLATTGRPRGHPVRRPPAGRPRAAGPGRLRAGRVG